ncbi:MAG TPA: hypothetical protein HPP83_12245 [Candidatus Hydrogenedentes bacterium]|nr:hypothetical protein [Candidatus Hydrogenedentota bacterium]
MFAPDNLNQVALFLALRDVAGFGSRDRMRPPQIDRPPPGGTLEWVRRVFGYTIFGVGHALVALGAQFKAIGSAMRALSDANGHGR